MHHLCTPSSQVGALRDCATPRTTLPLQVEQPLTRTYLLGRAGTRTRVPVRVGLSCLSSYALPVATVQWRVLRGAVSWVGRGTGIFHHCYGTTACVFASFYSLPRISCFYNLSRHSLPCSVIYPTTSPLSPPHRQLLPFLWKMSGTRDIHCAAE